ncbi:hypothetical protein Lesp02_29420 [Lentzea sp. NBRC 105346]|uniref:hypothetical protein n=1 Tax=Lentzea sp. NBRC 105346 TaxID=3032205 RepID=UPI0024A2CCF1|nr:hypothetical protein [Lentzea sp. NBRC 105346]GLZ30753.1 hypothetical protein Lesp02_29420 [Lentzea sp. NBRC 105346]
MRSFTKSVIVAAAALSVIGAGMALAGASEQQAPGVHPAGGRANMVAIAGHPEGNRTNAVAGGRLNGITSER